MRLVNFFRAGESREKQRLGSILEDTVLDIPAAWIWYSRQVRWLKFAPPATITEMVNSSQETGDAVRQISYWFLTEGLTAGSEGPGKLLQIIEETSFTTPIPRPATVRDFYAFEKHVRTAREIRGQAVPEEWYEIPVFYYSNPSVIFGPGEEVPYPAYTRELDYELELACVIGTAGRDLAPDQALKHIAGFTIMNDWSARDTQRQETRVGLGPTKAKDFATSFGPYLVTPDELEANSVNNQGTYDLRAWARIDGVERTAGSTRDMHYSFGEMLARASQGVTLQPGDLIGSGTVGGGCLLELTRGEGPWLAPGDLVELEIEGLGKLVNRVGRLNPHGQK
jgi:fumarylacetoacetate (FAA) hydrolase